MMGLPAGIGVVLIAAVLSTAGFLLISRFVPTRWLVADADAASALYATIGMVYAILIAISAIAVWEPHTEAGQSTEREAADLTEAYWSAGDLPDRAQFAIRSLITQYLHEVIDGEWPSLHTDRAPSERAMSLFAQLRTEANAIEPVGNRQQASYQQISAKISDAADARRSRIAAAGTGMPALLWPILIGGGIASIAFLYLFGLDRTFPNGLMMATVGGMIALMLFVIYQVEYPFSRDLGIDPDAFRVALTQVAGML